MPPVNQLSPDVLQNAIFAAMPARLQIMGVAIEQNNVSDGLQQQLDMREPPAAPAVENSVVDAPSAVSSEATVVGKDHDGHDLAQESSPVIDAVTKSGDYESLVANASSAGAAVSALEAVIAVWEKEGTHLDKIDGAKKELEKQRDLDAAEKAAIAKGAEDFVILGKAAEEKEPFVMPSKEAMAAFMGAELALNKGDDKAQVQQPEVVVRDGMGPDMWDNKFATGIDLKNQQPTIEVRGGAGPVIEHVDGSELASAPAVVGAAAIEARNQAQSQKPDGMMRKLNA
jgi:hypothetical protein